MYSCDCCQFLQLTANIGMSLENMQATCSRADSAVIDDNVNYYKLFDLLAPPWCPLYKIKHKN